MGKVSPLSRVRRLLSRLDPLVQIGLLIALAEVYRLLRRLIPTDWPQAIANAQRVERLEHVGHFAWEKGIQNWFLQFPELVKGLNWFYLSSHFVVTGAFFVWLYWRDREGFSIFRDGVLACHGDCARHPLALSDGAAEARRHGDQGHDRPVFRRQHRQAAPRALFEPGRRGAEPACGLGARAGCRRRALRTQRLLKALGVLYPAAVMLTIVVTGNHYIFDAAAGALVMALGFAATAPFRVGAREPAYARSR